MSTTSVRLLRRAKDPDTFDRLLAAFDGPAFAALAATDHGRAYYRLITPDSADHSFLFAAGDTAVAVVECDLADDRLARFGAPIELRVSPSAGTVRERARLIRDALGELQRIAPDMDVRTSDDLDPDGLVVANVSGLLAPQVDVRAEIDLSLPPDDLLADMRKGHRQQVRWGEANLAIRIVDAAAPDAFEAMRAFHAVVAGRVTRSAESWHAMRDAVLAGQGSLAIGTLDGRDVAYSLVMDGGDTAVYASGVYDRTLFDKPLAHALIYRSTLAARARGRRWFDVGHVPLDGQGTDKDRSIGNFKRGFTSRSRTSLVWTLIRDRG